jgi:pseudomonalisin
MRQRARIALPVAAAVTALAALPVLAATTGSSGTTMKVLSRDTLPATVLTNPVGAPSPTAHWHVGVSVQGRNATGLAQLARAQYDKSSPLYRHFLTPSEYAAQFGADPSAAAQVRSWLSSKGLDVSYANKAQTYFVADGTVAQVEKTFKVTLTKYVAGTTHFIANTTAPTVPTAVTAVAGLDTLSDRATTATTTPQDFPIPSVTSPQDLWSVYEQPADNRGQGEKLAAFGWGDYTHVDTDLRQFESENNLPQIPFNVVQVGAKGTDTSGLPEWDLDSQAASGMAPDAAGMTFYFANAGNSDLLAASVNTWADDPNGAKQASGSYGLCDVLGYLGVFDAHEAALTQAAAEGRSFFASTGDNGSGCSAVVNTNGITIGPIPSQEYPATSPHAIAVGGTVLYTTGSPTQRDEEIAWTHGGGGPSYFFDTPDWQADQPLAAEGRAVSDVAAQSGDLISGYNIVSEGSDTSIGGTSLSAPLWQGMWARVNGAGPLGADGVANLGFADPLIYANNADATKYAASFTDITVGDNGLYPALPGYDYPTGWGVPRVTGLALALAGKTTPSGSNGGTTGGGGTPPPPPPPLAECQPAPQVVDATGDATQAVVVDTGDSDTDRADLDIVDYGVKWDDAAKALTFTLHVSDLAAQPSSGEFYRLGFSHDGTDYHIHASRDVQGTTAFSLTLTDNTSLATLTGTFDPAKNEITSTLTAAQYATAQGGKAPLATGSNVSGLTVTAQQLAGVSGASATLTADDAATAAPCQVTFTAPAPVTTSCPPKKNGKPNPKCTKP